MLNRKKTTIYVYISKKTTNYFFQQHHKYDCFQTNLNQFQTLFVLKIL
jgi:hypothetical protein